MCTDGVPPLKGNDGVPPVKGNDGVPPLKGNDGVPPLKGNDGVSPLKGNDDRTYVKLDIYNYISTKAVSCSLYKKLIIIYINKNLSVIFYDFL